MAFKLTKNEQAQRSVIVEKLRLEAAHLEDAVSEFNEALQKAREQLELSRQAYNSVLDDARAFAFDVQGRISDEYDEKSERWQNGDNGTAARAWIEEWTEAAGNGLEDLEIEMPDDIDMPTIEDADTLENLQEQP